MRVEWVAMMPKRLDHERIWGAIGLVLGLAGLLVPIERLPLRCMFKTLTGLPCLTCGTTRAFVSLRHFDVVGALVDNPLVAALALVAAAYCVYAWIAVLFRTRRIRISLTRRREALLIRIGVVVAVLGNWAYLICVGR